MALIQCPECGHEMSDQLYNKCPKCGYINKSPNSKMRKTMIWIAIIIGFFIIMRIIASIVRSAAEARIILGN